MSFTRLPYDNDSYVTSLNESISPGAFMIETPRLACGSDCTFYAPGVNLNKFDDGMCEKELIDVDSELLGITRKNSQCPAKKYLPGEQPFCKAKTLSKDCTYLASEPTLISNPKATNKETTVNRWAWLCRNEQEKALIPFDWNISNRILTKMNHRPCAPKPLDQSAALPPKCNEFVRYDWASKYQRPATNLPGPALAPCDYFPKL